MESPYSEEELRTRELVFTAAFAVTVVSVVAWSTHTVIKAFKNNRATAKDKK